MVELYRCLGSRDFELNVEVAAGHEVTALVADLNKHCGGHINTIKVLAKFRDLKSSFVPF